MHVGPDKNAWILFWNYAMFTRSLCPKGAKSLWQIWDTKFTFEPDD